MLCSIAGRWERRFATIPVFVGRREAEICPKIALDAKELFDVAELMGWADLSNFEADCDRDFGRPSIYGVRGGR